MKLYELTGQYLEISNMMSDPDIDPQLIADTLESLDGEFGDKAEAYGKIIRNYQCMIDAIAAEKNRLDARKKTYENAIENMKNRLLMSMIAIDKKKIQTPLFLFSVKSKPPKLEIDNEEKVPKKYRISQPDKIDKALLLADLKKNGDQDYAHLCIGGKSLQMK